MESSGIILPGRPVDPDDPTKGQLTQVLTAPELTAAVFALDGRIDDLMMVTRAAVYEIGEMLERISVLLLENTPQSDALSDKEDEAVEYLKEFIDSRNTARETIHAELAAIQSQMEKDTAEDGVGAEEEPTNLAELFPDA